MTLALTYLKQKYIRSEKNWKNIRSEKTKKISVQKKNWKNLQGSQDFLSILNLIESHLYEIIIKIYIIGYSEKKFKLVYDILSNMFSVFSGAIIKT